MKEHTAVVKTTSCTSGSTCICGTKHYIELQTCTVGVDCFAWQLLHALAYLVWHTNISWGKFSLIYVSVKISQSLNFTS